MGCRIISGGCHSAERKNDDFAALRRLSLDREELDGGGAHVRDLPIYLEMIWSGYFMVRAKNGDFAALRQLSPDREELDGGGARVRELHP
ncbi:unnamed protein product [Spirodela intermedia]|uniref:Uncharacterized protein n=1 Tax=Spirodela intermedia TaxID=51605 RepID=A0A7I8KXX4_SPIIN|nr:unnamed protein product [Spirodela intermedia]